LHDQTPTKGRNPNKKKKEVIIIEGLGANYYQEKKWVFGGGTIFNELAGAPLLLAGAFCKKNSTGLQLKG